MILSDIMTTHVVNLEPDDTVLDAALAMHKHNIGTIPVCSDDNTLVGIVSDRDIVLRSTAANSKPARDKIDEIMTRPVVSAAPNTPVEEAARLMSQHKIRRLPVVDGGRLVGIVSIGDLATRSEFDRQAGQALSSISQPAVPQNM